MNCIKDTLLMASALTILIFIKMNRTATYLCILILLPAIARAQTITVRKNVNVGRTQIDVHSKGVCFGQNPIFLVPMDTLGNVSFTGSINNVKVMGSFAPATYGVDTTEVQDPITGEYIEMYDIGIRSLKNGEWNYYFNDGANYREYYDMGVLIRTDSFNSVLRADNREIKIVDSMARIRSMVDLYLKKGSR